MKTREELLAELLYPLMVREAELAKLRAKNEELERLYSEAVALNMRQAQTSDAMKLELIMSGALQVPKEKEPLDHEKLAEVAYGGYGDAAGWKAYNNEAMPSWEALPPHIKDRWIAAMKAVAVSLG